MLSLKRHCFSKYVFFAVLICSSQVLAQEDDEIIDSSGIVRRYTASEQSVKIADKALKGEIFLTSYFDAYQTPNGITWDENPYKNETWCFYYQSMDLIGHLNNAFEFTSNEKYIEMSKDLIDKWEKKNISFWTTSTWSLEKYFYRLSFIRKGSRCFVWDDHSAANRTTNMIQFYFDYKKTEKADPAFLKKVEALLELHGQFLADHRNYNDDNNHGIFQDRALLELVYLFPQIKEANQWYSIAINRLSARLEREVTASGVHKEHSPTYHSIILTLFKDITRFLRPDDINTKHLKEIVYKMEDYLAYVMEPDGTFPNIGDSAPDRLKYALNNDTNPHLAYMLTQGKKGSRPEDTIVYKDAGVAIFRNSWFPKNPFFLMFTAAMHSKVHKHADDLSFVLHYGSTDFLVDSGKYSYNGDDPYRKYFRSALAHNSVIVDGETYPVKTYQIGQSRIESFGNNDEAAFVTGSHDFYKGIKIKRTLMYAKKGFVLIHDQITSNKEHIYTQNFQIGKNVEIEEQQNRILLKDKKTKDQIDLIELNPGSFTIRKGKENPIQGWMSTKFNKKFPISTVSYSTEGTNAEFKTVISLDPKIKITDYTHIDTEESDTFEIEQNIGNKLIFVIQKKN